MKTQIVVDTTSKKILRTFFGCGRTHDLKLLKDSHLRLDKKIKVIADLGYLGLAQYHCNSVVAHKSSKLKKLTKEQKRENRALTKSQVVVEHAFAMLKRFKIFTYPYRNRRKGFALRFNLLDAICNLEI